MSTQAIRALEVQTSTANQYFVHAAVFAGNGFETSSDGTAKFYEAYLAGSFAISSLIDDFSAFDQSLSISDEVCFIMSTLLTTDSCYKTVNLLEI